MAVFFGWAMVGGTRIQGTGNLMKFALFFFAPLMGFVIGSSAITVGYPIIGTAIAGADTELTFTVTDINRSVDRRCRNPIKLDGLPHIFDRLCGFSEDFGRSLETGRQVRVFGKGTKMGVFVESAGKVE